MKKILLLALVTALLFSLKSAPLKIAFLGDSITIGSGLKNAKEECYPSQFAQLLQTTYGDKYQVENFAVSGRTMLRHGDYPLWNEPQFKQALEYKPDVVYIMLGTNDTKPQNWDKYGDEFATDYQAMIDTFKTINPDAKFILAFPPPAFQLRWGIRDSVIIHGVNPVVKEMIKNNKTYSVDYYRPLRKKSRLFPDGIHPDATGAGLMAGILFKFFNNNSSLRK